jgi:hypothetical protein
LTAGLCPAVVFSGGMGTILDRSRFPAELQLLRGDFDRSISMTELSASERLGLQGRIDSAVGGLEWLAMEYETITQTTVDRHNLDLVFDAWRRQESERAVEALESLIEQHPLNLRIFAAERATNEDLQRVREIDATLCSGCHTASPGSPNQLPAYRLSELARSMTSTEFLARLLSGVRGTEETLLANPLSMKDMRGFMALYGATDTDP